MSARMRPNGAWTCNSPRVTLETARQQSFDCIHNALPRQRIACPHLPPSESRDNTRMSGKIVYVTDDSFEDDVLKSGTPVLVDYWADWCGPCKMIAPVLEEVAEQFDGKVTIAKLNIDENPTTPPKFGIRGIPTLMLFKDGEVEATKVGAVSKSQLIAFIDSNV